MTRHIPVYAEGDTFSFIRDLYDKIPVQGVGDRVPKEVSVYCSKNHNHGSSPLLNLEFIADNGIVQVQPSWEGSFEVRGPLEESEIYNEAVDSLLGGQRPLGVDPIYVALAKKMSERHFILGLRRGEPQKTRFIDTPVSRNPTVAYRPETKGEKQLSFFG